MMTSRISKTTKFFLTGAAGVAFCAATASADIHTFWKADTCPDFGGTKTAIGAEVGVMESVLFSKDPLTGGIGAGGAFCVLDSIPRVTIPLGKNAKGIFVLNADVLIAVIGEQLRCVVCQYEDKIGIPAMSLLGTIILMAGLLTAGAYQIGKKQRAEAAA